MVRCPTTATRKKPYAPSNPPAEDSAASWNNSRISAATYPQIPPTSHFSQSRKNPFANQLKRQITIRLDTMAVHYFKEMAAELGMPYQNLINLFLRDCATQKRRPVIQWPPEAPKGPVGR
jgi:uncharacterized protein (DUF4415 family)